MSEETEQKRGRGRPAHVPTQVSKELVQLHTIMGSTQEIVARILGIDLKTLRKHYRDELDLAQAQANATVGGALFNKAKGGDTAAMIFWMKTRAGWRETTHLDHSSTDGSMTPTRIMRVIVDPADND